MFAVVGDSAGDGHSLTMSFSPAASSSSSCSGLVGDGELAGSDPDDAGSLPSPAAGEFFAAVSGRKYLCRRKQSLGKLGTLAGQNGIGCGAHLARAVDLAHAVDEALRGIPLAVLFRLLIEPHAGRHVVQPVRVLLGDRVAPAILLIEPPVVTTLVSFDRASKRIYSVSAGTMRLALPGDHRIVRVLPVLVIEWVEVGRNLDLPGRRPSM